MFLYPAPSFCIAGPAAAEAPADHCQEENGVTAEDAAADWRIRPAEPAAAAPAPRTEALVVLEGWGVTAGIRR